VAIRIKRRLKGKEEGEERGKTYSYTNRTSSNVNEYRNYGGKKYRHKNEKKKMLFV